jgi:hypothetical protein
MGFTDFQMHDVFLCISTRASVCWHLPYAKIQQYFLKVDKQARRELGQKGVGAG